MVANVFNAGLGPACLRAFQCDPYTGRLQLPKIGRKRVGALKVDSADISGLKYREIAGTCRALHEAGKELAGTHDDYIECSVPGSHDEWTVTAGGTDNFSSYFRYQGSGDVPWNEITVQRFLESERNLGDLLQIGFIRRQPNRVAHFSYSISPVAGRNRRSRVATSAGISVTDIGVLSLKRYFAIPEFTPVFALKEATLRAMQCDEAIIDASRSSAPSDIPELIGDIGYPFETAGYEHILDTNLMCEDGTYREHFGLLMMTESEIGFAPLPPEAQGLWQWATANEEKISVTEAARYLSWTQTIVTPSNQQSH